MTQKPLALIVDDEPDILQLLGITLSRMDITTHKAETINHAKELLSQHHFDFCLTDMRLPDGNGIELIQFIQKNYREMPVALITAHGNMETAIEAMKAGAFDFLSKPVDLTSLRALINNAIQLNTKPKIIEKIDSSQSTSKMKKQLIGDTDVMKLLKQTILKLARSQAPVYINGESGTGKELVAKLIHHKGPRSSKPFVAVNCGAIPSELMESEFFGHLKGSFTSAVADKKGLFKAADGGTLFLDEIAELPMAMQVKLLRAIQEKSIRPVGSEKEFSVDTRILSASHKDLIELVNNGGFRQDLFYRINVIQIDVPALRDRKADIAKLTQYLLKQLSLVHGLENFSISKNAINQLTDYQFPGNIRELENILERALTLSSEDIIRSVDLKLPKHNPNTPLLLQNSNMGNGISDRKQQPLDEYLENIENHEIICALKETNGNKTKAAKILGISFRAMRYKLDKLNITQE